MSRLNVTLADTARFSDAAPDKLANMQWATGGRMLDGFTAAPRMTVTRRTSPATWAYVALGAALGLAAYAAATLAHLI